MCSQVQALKVLLAMLLCVGHGCPRPPNPRVNKFIILQIDGLSTDILLDYLRLASGQDDGGIVQMVDPEFLEDGEIRFRFERRGGDFFTSARAYGLVGTPAAAAPHASGRFGADFAAGLAAQGVDFIQVGYEDPATSDQARVERVQRELEARPGASVVVLRLSGFASALQEPSNSSMFEALEEASHLIDSILSSSWFSSSNVTTIVASDYGNRALDSLGVGRIDTRLVDEALRSVGCELTYSSGGALRTDSCPVSLAASALAEIGPGIRPIVAREEGIFSVYDPHLKTLRTPVRTEGYLKSDASLLEMHIEDGQVVALADHGQGYYFARDGSVPFAVWGGASRAEQANFAIGAGPGIEVLSALLEGRSRDMSLPDAIIEASAEGALAEHRVYGDAERAQQHFGEPICSEIRSERGLVQCLHELDKPADDRRLATSIQQVLDAIEPTGKVTAESRKSLENLLTWLRSGQTGRVVVVVDTSSDQRLAGSVELMTAESSSTWSTEQLTLTCASYELCDHLLRTVASLPRVLAVIAGPIDRTGRSRILVALRNFWPLGGSHSTGRLVRIPRGHTERARRVRRRASVAIDSYVTLVNLSETWQLSRKLSMGHIDQHELDPEAAGWLVFMMSAHGIDHDARRMLEMTAYRNSESNRWPLDLALLLRSLFLDSEPPSGDASQPRTVSGIDRWRSESRRQLATALDILNREGKREASPCSSGFGGVSAQAAVSSAALLLQQRGLPGFAALAHLYLKRSPDGLRSKWLAEVLNLAAMPEARWLRPVLVAKVANASLANSSESLRARIALFLRTVLADLAQEGTLLNDGGIVAAIVDQAIRFPRESLAADLPRLALRYDQILLQLVLRLLELGISREIGAVILLIDELEQIYLTRWSIDERVVETLVVLRTYAEVVDALWKRSYILALETASNWVQVRAVGRSEPALKGLTGLTKFLTSAAGVRRLVGPVDRADDELAVRALAEFTSWVVRHFSQEANTTESWQEFETKLAKVFAVAIGEARGRPRDWEADAQWAQLRELVARPLSLDADNVLLVSSAVVAVVVWAADCHLNGPAAGKEVLASASALIDEIAARVGRSEHVIGRMLIPMLVQLRRSLNSREPLRSPLKYVKALVGSGELRQGEAGLRITMWFQSLVAKATSPAELEKFAKTASPLEGVLLLNLVAFLRLDLEATWQREGLADQFLAELRMVALRAAWSPGTRLAASIVLAQAAAMASDFGDGRFATQLANAVRDTPGSSELPHVVLPYLASSVRLRWVQSLLSSGAEVPGWLVEESVGSLRSFQKHCPLLAAQAERERQILEAARGNYGEIVNSIRRYREGHLVLGRGPLRVLDQGYYSRETLKSGGSLVLLEILGLGHSGLLSTPLLGQLFGRYPGQFDPSSVAVPDTLIDLAALALERGDLRSFDRSLGELVSVYLVGRDSGWPFAELSGRVYDELVLSDPYSANWLSQAAWMLGLRALGSLLGAPAIQQIRTPVVRIDRPSSGCAKGSSRDELKCAVPARFLYGERTRWSWAEALAMPILDRQKSSRNRWPAEQPMRMAHRHNPLAVPHWSILVGDNSFPRPFLSLRTRDVVDVELSSSDVAPWIRTGRRFPCNTVVRLSQSGLYRRFDLLRVFGRLAEDCGTPLSRLLFRLARISKLDPEQTMVEMVEVLGLYRSKLWFLEVLIAKGVAEVERRIIWSDQPADYIGSPTFRKLVDLLEVRGSFALATHLKGLAAVSRLSNPPNSNADVEEAIQAAGGVYQEALQRNLLSTTVGPPQKNLDGLSERLTHLLGLAAIEDYGRFAVAVESWMDEDF